MADTTAFLLLDDDAVILEAMSPVIRRSYPQATVTGCLSYDDGIQFMRHMPKNGIVICDYDLRQEHNGAEFLAAVEKERPDLARILLSGHSRETLAQAFNKCKPHAFVRKPDTMEDLVAPFMQGVQQALAAARQQTQAPPVDEATRQDAEIYRLLVESVKDYAIFVLDPEGKVASWNPGAQRINGYTANEILGKHFRTFYTPEDRQRHHPEAELQLAIAHGRYEEEGIRVRRDGTRFWANVVITPLYGTDGKLRGFAKVTRDLTQRKQNEEQMRRHAEALEDLTQELEAFSYTAAHDLRAPLRGLLFEVDRAKRGGPDTAKHLDNAVAQARKMGRLIEDLLQLAQATKVELAPAPVDITALARELADETWRRLQRDPSEVEVQPGIEVVADARSMRVILGNLLDNAAKFTAQQPTPRIEVGAMRTPQGQIVYVRDNGVGFEPQLADRLFRPFQRLHAGTQFEGTGLGLATVRRIVDRHQGRTWIDAKPGQGATVYLMLPGKKESAPFVLTGSGP